MNEPIQHAQESTGKVTVRQLLAIVKAGTDRLSLRGRAAPARASYSDSFIFEVRATSERKGVSSSSVIEVPGWVSNGYTSARESHMYEGREVVSYRDVFRPESGFWYFGCGSETLTSVLENLPWDAEVGFTVALDHGTNEILTRANAKMNYESYEGLHCDYLYLIATAKVRGKERTYRFLIDTSAGTHNTARFGYMR